MAHSAGHCKLANLYIFTYHMTDQYVQGKSIPGSCSGEKKVRTNEIWGSKFNSDKLESLKLCFLYACAWFLGVKAGQYHVTADFITLVIKHKS